MKGIFILAFATLTLNGAAQWINLNSGTSEWLRSVCFTHPDTGYVAGFNGTILKTVDGGSNWVPKNSGTSSDLHGIFFVNSLTGWAVGENATVLKTLNGGENWSPQIGFGTVLHDVFFVDFNNGFIAGEGSSLKTTDGGASWSPMTTNTGNGRVSVYFNDANNGYISGIGVNDAIIKTTDGGASWANNYASIVEEFCSIVFTDVNNGYAVSSNGDIASTNNAGSSWSTHSSIAASLYSVKFPSSAIGYAVGGYPNSSQILATTNGGSSWSSQVSSSSQPLFGVHFANNTVGYAVGKNGAIIKTVTGGVGIHDEKQENIFSVYPNPASNTLSLLINEEDFHNVKNMEIINAVGQITKLELSKTINVKDYNQGLYFLRLVLVDGTNVIKQFAKE